MKELILKVINKFLKIFQKSRGKERGKTVYLTFDDGPEPGITEYVLEQLARYKFKATFFCRGDNAENNPELLQAIRTEGHAIGNHTYSHVHCFKEYTDTYVDDVHKADDILGNTILFRAPWGSLTLPAFIKLRRYYTFIYWSLESGDTELQKFEINRNLNRLKLNTRGGDIVLFHFCHRHEKETRQILPPYLEWLNENGYVSKKL